MLSAWERGCTRRGWFLLVDSWRVSSWYSLLCIPTSYIYTYPCPSWVEMKFRYESILIEKSSIYFSCLPLAKVLERSVPRGLLTLLRILPHFHVRRGIGGHRPARVADLQLRTWDRMSFYSLHFWGSHHRPPGGFNWNSRGEKNVYVTRRRHQVVRGLSISSSSSASSSGSWGELRKWLLKIIHFPFQISLIER